ncbi:MAG: hypothetical protein IK990_17140 [Ruminiclostridium sp.]|nr:hypothetical protein [Ruminiclostridium sp.]
MKQKNIPLFALSAALLLSGCNADKPAETSVITGEVTTTTTAAVMITAASTTTASVTTTLTTTTTAATTAAADPIIKEETTFAVHELEIRHVEDAPDVGSEANWYIIADEKAYCEIDRAPEALHAIDFMRFAEHSDHYDKIKTDFADYIDGIKLVTEKVRELPRVMSTYQGLFGKEPYDGSKYKLEWYRLGDEWLIEFNNDDFMNLYMYDEKSTELRRIAELLRQDIERFPHLSVVAVTESSNVSVSDYSVVNELSLAIIDTDAEETESVREYLTETGADISLCSFNELWEKQKEISVYSLTDYDRHYIALTSGVYLQASVPGTNESEAVRCIREMCGDELADEAEKRGLAIIAAERKNIGIYGYLSLFDIVPVREPFGETRAVMLNDNVLLCAVGKEYTLYTYDKEMTAFRETVTALRRHHEIHDTRMDFCIEALELDDDNITVIAPEDQWENIRKFAKEQWDIINKDLIEYSEKFTKDYSDVVHRR